MAFATVADLEARWRSLTEAEEAQASVLLDDAAAYLQALVEVDPDDEVQAANLKMVSCNMVKRAMSSSASDAFGVTNATATMGPFSQQVAYANPSGDMYVSKSERAILGIGTATIGSIRAHTDIRTVRHARR
jgi:hypothetical protein